MPEEVVTEPAEPIPEKVDPYQQTLDYEALEVTSRTETDDQEVTHKILDKIQDIMDDVLNVKNEKPENLNTLVDERKKEGLLLMLALRHLNRIQKMRVRAAREKTVEQRQSVDGVTLQLQNLLYEVNHVKKEVRKCLEFKSADEEIDLVSLEHFYRDAPESISRPSETKKDPHQQRLARLHWELEQRKDQTQLFEKITKEKEDILGGIQELNAKLFSLVPRIACILEATKPLQEALDLPMDNIRKQQQNAELLPAALYCLWVQACAYRDACDPQLEVQIMGNAEEVHKWAKDDIKESPEGVSDEASKMEITEGEEASPDPIRTLHAMRVALCINTKDKNSVKVVFSYATYFRIVTVKCSVLLAKTAPATLVDVLSGDNFLSCLYPKDDGLSSPNPATFYLLAQYGIHTLTEQHLKVLGRPYRWAQTLGGLSFMPSCKADVSQVSQQVKRKAEEEEEEEEDVDEDEEDEDRRKREPRAKRMKKEQRMSEEAVEAEKLSPSGITQSSIPSETACVSWKVSAEHMSMTIQALRQRLAARLALHKQLLSLEDIKSNSSIGVPPELLAQNFPGKVTSEIKSWQPISLADYTALPATQMLLEGKSVSEQHMLFKAVFERKHVKLEAFVSISPDHPDVVPLFALALYWEGVGLASNNQHVRQMEAELNMHYQEMVPNKDDVVHILPLQLYRAAMCLDVYTEAYSACCAGSKSEVEFHKEKIFFRTTSGRDRAFPFKYLPKLGVFAQR